MLLCEAIALSMSRRRQHTCFAYVLIPPVSATPTAFACANRSIPRRRRLFIRFFCICRRKRKSYQKENADVEISRSAERGKGSFTPSRRRRHTCFAYVLIPRQPYYAGVQTMRARICSAISCDMFARVVWLKLRRVRHCCFPLCPLPHALATHGFARLTRARRGN